MAKIIIPESLKDYTNNQTIYITGGTTVGASITELIAQYPDIKQHLVDSTGEVKKKFTILIGNKNINLLNKEHTSVKNHSEIKFIENTSIIAN